MKDQDLPASSPRHPSEGEIRARAYRLYEQGGGESGSDVEHWLRAEAELTATAPRSPAAIPQKWQWHDRKLRHIRNVLTREHTERSLAVRTPLPHGGADVVDIANDEAEHSAIRTELSLEAAELAEVEAALERIRNGTYGICEVTGQPIAPARLRAIPWTRRCVAAARSAQPPTAFQNGGSPRD